MLHAVFKNEKKKKRKRISGVIFNNKRLVLQLQIIKIIIKKKTINDLAPLRLSKLDD